MRRGTDRLKGSCGLTVVLALLLAPMTAIVRPACDHCPPDCPMHANAHGASTKRGCHESGSSAKVGQHCQTKTGFMRPGCGHARVTAPIAIARAVLPERNLTWVAPVRFALTEHAPAMFVRDADPPESPPPIVSA